MTNNEQYHRLSGQYQGCYKGRRHIGRNEQLLSIRRSDGYRKHISDRFMIYPVLGFSVRDFDSRELVIRTLVRWYKKNIKHGCSVSETVLSEKECKVGLYDPAFFKEAHFFEKNEDGYYLFQMYKYYKTTDSVRKKFIPFPFFSNQPDSIKEKWRYKD